MKVAEFLSGWPVWGLPAFAQIWAPWHDKITNFHLISDYFQPALGGVTSTLGHSPVFLRMVRCTAREPMQDSGCWPPQPQVSF
jgi:hypothetical protein